MAYHGAECKFCHEDINWSWAPEGEPDTEPGWGWADGMSYIRCSDSSGRLHQPIPDDRAAQNFLTNHPVNRSFQREGV